MKFGRRIGGEISKKNIKFISVFGTNYIADKENSIYKYWILSFIHKYKDNIIEWNTLGKTMVINDIEKLEKIASLYAESEEDNIQNMNYFTNNEN